MKRLNSQKRLRTCGFFMILAVALIITSGANQAYAVEFSDYCPVDPEDHGVKTCEWTEGPTGQYTSEIIGTGVVPYTTGAITGARISNFSDFGVGIVYNNGLHVKFLGSDSYYVSIDSSLTAHPLSWSFATLTDGMIIDQGEHYWVKSDLSSWEMVDNQQILISIQDVSVLEGNYQDAVIFWWLDTDYPFTTLNLHGKESDLGITLPTASDTGGHAVTAFDIFGFGTGQIAVGDIEALTGSLNYLSELKEIRHIPTISGWVWMESGSDFAYSYNEDDLLYFLSFGPVWYYNLTTGQWNSEEPAGWIYINWPFYYELDSGDLWFVLPPPGGDRFWVYHFSTGQWEALPTIIP